MCVWFRGSVGLLTEHSSKRETPFPEQTTMAEELESERLYLRGVIPPHPRILVNLSDRQSPHAREPGAPGTGSPTGCSSAQTVHSALALSLIPNSFIQIISGAPFRCKVTNSHDSGS